MLEEGIVQGRKAFMNMTKYIKITASSNFGNIFSIVLASVLLPFFPMTALQLLLLNLLYDTLCLSLLWDNVDEDECEKPLEWSGRSLGKFMRFFGPVSSLFDIISFVFLYFVLCPLICGGSYRGLSPLLCKPARKLSFRLANVLPDAVFLISSGLADFLIKSLNSDEFKSTVLGNEKSELKTLKYSVKKEKL